jgi:hypothetical protein
MVSETSGSSLGCRRPGVGRAGGTPRRSAVQLVQADARLPEQRIGCAPEVAKDGPDPLRLDEPAAGARLPQAPLPFAARSAGHRTATMRGRGGRR